MEKISKTWTFINFTEKWDLLLKSHSLSKEHLKITLLLVLMKVLGTKKDWLKLLKMLIATTLLWMLKSFLWDSRPNLLKEDRTYLEVRNKEFLLLELWLNNLEFLFLMKQLLLLMLRPKRRYKMLSIRSEMSTKWPSLLLLIDYQLSKEPIELLCLDVETS